MMVIFTFGVALQRWIRAVNLFIVCCVSEKYDYISLHFNVNSTQIYQSLVFKFSDHKANIFLHVFAKTLQLVNILYFDIFLENQTYLNTNHFDTTCTHSIQQKIASC